MKAERITETNNQLALWSEKSCRLWGYNVSHSTGLLRLEDDERNAQGLEIWCAGIKKLHLDNIGFNDCTLKIRLDTNTDLLYLEEGKGRMIISCSLVNIGISTQEEMTNKWCRQFAIT
jgi:hypothetical protein